MFLTVSRKVVLLLLLPLVFLLVFTVLISQLKHVSESRAVAIGHSKDIIAQTQELLREVTEATNAMSGFAVTRDVRFANRSERFQREIEPDFSHLIGMFETGSSQLATVHQLEAETRELVVQLDRLRTAVTRTSEEEGATLRPLLSAADNALRKLQSDGALLLGQEQRLDELRDAALTHEWDRIDDALVFGAGFAAVLTLALGVLLGRDISHRLRRLAENARQFGQGKPLLDRIGGADEIGVLDGTFHHMSAALTRARVRERALMENAADVLCSFDLDGRFSDVSAAATRVFGYDRTQLEGKSWIELMVLPEEQEATRLALRQLASGGSSTFETRCCRADGRVISVAWSASWSATDRLVYGVARDLTERLLAENERRFYLETIDRLEEAVFELDRDGVVVQMSKAWQPLAGAPVETILGTPLARRAHPEDQAVFSEAVSGLLLGGQAIAKFRFRLQRTDGAEAWVDAQLLPHKDALGTVTGLRGMLRDVTQSYLQERRIAKLALHDPLTHLPNRTLLDDRLQMALASARRSGLRMALGFIDLDNFKKVNDTLGHDAGDQVLRRLAQSLTVELRKGDTLARWGGDEFVVLLTDLAGPEEATAISERLLAAAAAASRATDVTVSIGLALYPDHGDSAEALLKLADRAMFRAKHSGKNNFRISERTASDVSIPPPSLTG